MLRAILVVAVFAGGCGASDDDEIFTSTAVSFQQDGTPIINRTQISKRDQLAEFEAWKAVRDGNVASTESGLHGLTANQQGNCSPSAHPDQIALYDQSNFTGNVIC